MMRLWIVAGWFWPILWILAAVWWYLAGVQGASMNSMLCEAVRVCPCAAASMLMMMFMVFTNVVAAVQWEETDLFRRE